MNQTAELNTATSSTNYGLCWDHRTRELTSPRHTLTLHRAEAILFDALWRANGKPIKGRYLAAACGVKKMNQARFDHLSNKLTPFLLYIAADHLGGYWLEFLELT